MYLLHIDVCVLCVQVPHAAPRHAVSKAKEMFRSTSMKCLEEAESEWEFTQCGVQTFKTAFRLLNLGFLVSKVNHSQECCWEEVQFPRHTQHVGTQLWYQG